MHYDKQEFIAFKHSSFTPEQEKSASDYVKKLKEAKNARLRECGRLNELLLSSKKRIHVFQRVGQTYVADCRDIGFVYAIDWIYIHRCLDEMIESGVRDLS